MPVHSLHCTVVTTTIWLGNTPTAAELETPEKNRAFRDKLVALFMPFGSVEHVNVLDNMSFVRFASRASAVQARLQMAGQEVDGRPLKVSVCSCGFFV